MVMKKNSPDATPVSPTQSKLDENASGRDVEVAASPPGASTRRRPRAAASISPEGGGRGPGIPPPSLRRPKLSPRQEVVLEFIEVFIERRGWPPTLREIALGTGISSVSTAFDHCQALYRKGYIELGGGARQIRVVT